MDLCMYVCMHACMHARMHARTHAACRCSLQTKGALDESNPMEPLVIIPNYLTMRSNCINVSSFYDLCCIDLCEDGSLACKT